MKKRTLTSALAALVLSLTGFLAVPEVAHAANAQQTQGGITCYNETTNNTPATWPGINFWYCGSGQSSSFGNQDLGYLADQAGNTSNPVNAKTKLFDAGVKIFVFQNNTAFSTFCNGAVTSPAGAKPLIPNGTGGTTDVCFSTTSGNLDQYTRGFTLTNTTYFPYSVIVEQYIDQPSGKTVLNQPPLGSSQTNFMPFVLLHEQGHHIDWLFGATLSSTYITKSNQWATQLAYDWSHIIVKDIANKSGDTNGCNNVYGSKMFVNWRDSNGAWICNNNGAGPGVNTAAKAGYEDSWNNQQVLQAAWPYYYAPDTNPNSWSNGQETMASINANESGGFHAAGPQIAGTGKSATTQDGGQWLPLFTCTGALVYNLAYSGSIQLCTQ